MSSSARTARRRPSSIRTARTGRDARTARTARTGRAVLTVATALLALTAVGQAHATPTAGGGRGSVVVVADGGTANPDMLCSLC